MSEQQQDQHVTGSERVLAAALFLGAFLVGAIAADLFFDLAISRWLSGGTKLTSEAEDYLRSAAHGG